MSDYQHATFSLNKETGEILVDMETSPRFDYVILKKTLEHIIRVGNKQSVTPTDFSYISAALMLVIVDQVLSDTGTVVTDRTE